MIPCQRSRRLKQAHTQSVEELIDRHNRTQMSDGPKTLLKIELINDFEAMGAYETWNTFFRVTKDDIVMNDECLICALERISRVR